MSSLKPPPDELSRARILVGRYARGRVRSIREVLAYLRRRGVPSATAARVIVECRARGMLDDETCARLWADHWARRGYAWQAIHAKLTAKGLDEQAIGRVARRFGTAVDDEAARARRVATAYLRRHHATGTTQRLARTLSSRGFDSEVIERVLTESIGSPSSE